MVSMAAINVCVCMFKGGMVCSMTYKDGCKWHNAATFGLDVANSIKLYEQAGNVDTMAVRATTLALCCQLCALLQCDKGWLPMSTTSPTITTAVATRSSSSGGGGAAAAGTFVSSCKRCHDLLTWSVLAVL